MKQGLKGRYDRNLPALSADECAMLAQKKVCIVGCGGLGGNIIEYLARIGVGTLVLVDGDVFENSNLNRQLTSEESLIGQLKAKAAAKRVSKVNSEIKVLAAAELFTKESSARLLQGCDLAIDALDTAESRLVLAQACTDMKIPLVHGAISGWFAQAAVIMPGSGLMEQIYPPRARNTPSRGNLSFIAAMCATVQSAEAVKLLCGRPTALQGHILFIDVRTMEFTKVKL